MLRFAAIALMLFWASHTLAAEVVLRIGEGRHYLRIDVATDGTVVIRKLAVVAVGDAPEPPRPPPGPPDDSSVEDKVKNLTASALRTGTPTTAKMFALVYRKTGEALAAGSVDDAKSLNAIEQGTAQILAIRSDDASWTAWIAGVDSIVTEQRQRGRYGSQTLLDIAAGIESAAVSSLTGEQVSGAKAKSIFDGFDIEQFMKLFLFILQLLGGL